MREEFEKLPKIANIIPKDSAFMFSEEDNRYFDYDDTREIEGFINGAWYTYQEQQKKIEQLLEIINAGLKIEQNMNNQIHSLKEKIDTAIEYLDSIEGLVWYEQIKELLK